MFAAFHLALYDWETNSILFTAWERAFVLPIREIGFPRVIHAVLEAWGCEPISTFTTGVLYRPGPNFPKDPSPWHGALLKICYEISHAKSWVQLVLYNFSSYPVDLNSSVIGIRTSRPFERFTAHQSHALLTFDYFIPLFQLNRI